MELLEGMRMKTPQDYMNAVRKRDNAEDLQQSALMKTGLESVVCNLTKLKDPKADLQSAQQPPPSKSKLAKGNTDVSKSPSAKSGVTVKTPVPEPAQAKKSSGTPSESSKATKKKR